MTRSTVNSAANEAVTNVSNAMTPITTSTGASSLLDHNCHRVTVPYGRKMNNNNKKNRIKSPLQSRPSMVNTQSTNKRQERGGSLFMNITYAL